MIDPKIVIKGADAVSSLFKAAGLAVDAEITRTVSRYGQILRTRIQAKASGRPGPNAPTGDYRRSWTVDLGFHDGMHSALVGTMKPQGRRLEHGFVGVDSLDRHYNQPPYPHVGPAADEVGPEFEHAVELIPVKLLHLGGRRRA